LFHWEVLIEGPIGSPYEGVKFVIDFDFPEQFPFKFPLLKFRTPIYHPNIKEGLICQEMLGEKEWLPNKKVQEIIETVLGMLAHPDVSSAINIEAANQVK
jgi:ubiquitin-protein ligase